MPLMQFKQEEDENIEVHVKVPTPKPQRTKAITVAIIGACAVILAALITRGAIPMSANSLSNQIPASTPTPTATQEQRATALSYRAVLQRHQQ